MEEKGPERGEGLEVVLAKLEERDFGLQNCHLILAGLGGSV